MATEVKFDSEVLKARGIGSGVAEFFRHQVRFPPGEAIVNLSVNGRERGVSKVRFGDEGQLCFDAALIKQANLVTPGESNKVRAGTSDARHEGSECHQYHEDFPRTIVSLHPNESKVEIVVPHDALSISEHAPPNYQSGGVGGVINYNLFASRSEFSGRKSSYEQANFQAGMNVKNWMLRSHVIYSGTTDKSEWAHLYTYAAHVMTEQKAMLQIGQINMASTLFSSPSLLGFQIVPEASLKSPGRGNGVVIDGIAQSPARVEVRQSGIMIFATLVPPGPFSLGDLPLLSVTTDLDVTVIEADTTRHKFTVSASTFPLSQLEKPGSFSLTVGQVRNGGSPEFEKSWVVSAERTFLASRRMNLNLGAMSTNRYHAIAGGWDALLSGTTSMRGNQTLSIDRRNRQNGLQFNVGLYTSWRNGLSAGVTTTRRTVGYRDFLETTSDFKHGQEQFSKSQYAANLVWSHRRIGGVSLNHSRSEVHSGRSRSRMTVAWSKRIANKMDVSLNYQHSKGIRHSHSDKSLYVGLSMPFGAGAVSGHGSRGQGGSTYGMRLNQKVDDQTNYSLSTERDIDNGTHTMGGTLNVIPRYMQMNVSANQSDFRDQAYSAHVSGALVAHDSGVTASPYPVADTFGIVSVGDIPGVKMNTSSGPIWTDWRGMAVLPNMPPYSATRVEVATKTLPKNVDLDNGIQVLTPGYASVSRMNFDVVKTRRMLLDVTSSDGKPLPKGSLILNEAGEYVTAVTGNGKVFISIDGDDVNLTAKISEQENCTLRLTLKKQLNSDEYFEHAEAICEPF